MSDLDLPSSWRHLTPANWRGPILFIGPPDAGKSTALRVAFERLRTGDVPTAVIDGDPGQSTLGPPATLTAAVSAGGDRWPPNGAYRHWFVGATTPSGHMLDVVVGARRLADAVREAGAETILYDTTGLIAVQRGGRALKYAIIDLLRPRTIVALQRTDELEPMLSALRRRSHLRLLELTVPSAARRRSTEQRRRHRAKRFASYFEASSLQTVHWPDLAVIPSIDFTVHQLVAFETPDGFASALGRIEALDREASTLTVETPLATLGPIEALHLGDVHLDPGTYEDDPR